MSFYNPNHNAFGISFFNEVPVFVCIYFLIIFLALVYRLLKKERPMLMPLAWIFLSAIVIFQTIDQHQFFRRTQARMAHKTEQEKKGLIFGYTYFFTEFAKQFLPDHSQGQLSTDLDMTQTLEPYILKYELYPSIDLITPQSADCLIVFNKQDSKEVVGKDFKIIAYFDRNSLLALRRP